MYSTGLPAITEEFEVVVAVVPVDDWAFPVPAEADGDAEGAGAVGVAPGEAVVLPEPVVPPAAPGRLGAGLALAEALAAAALAANSSGSGWKGSAPAVTGASPDSSVGEGVGVGVAAGAFRCAKLVTGVLADAFALPPSRPGRTRKATTARRAKPTTPAI